jgi:hypothetical protein
MAARESLNDLDSLLADLESSSSAAPSRPISVMAKSKTNSVQLQPELAFELDKVSTFVSLMCLDHKIHQLQYEKSQK